MDFSRKKCAPCEGGTTPLDAAEVRRNLQNLNGWIFEGGVILKTFSFRNYDETLAFVNAVAGIARREDHHPDISFGYKQCRVQYSTHSINGISQNDFICAEMIESFLSGSEQKEKAG